MADERLIGAVGAPAPAPPAAAPVAGRRRRAQAGDDDLLPVVHRRDEVDAGLVGSPGEPSGALDGLLPARA